MTIRCKLLGHKYRLVGGVARNVGPHRENPPNAQYSCARCSKRRTVEGITVRTAQAGYYSDPDGAERASQSEVNLR